MATFTTRFDPPGGAPTRVAVKDLIDMAGVPTTNGSKVVAARSEAAPPAADAVCLRGTRAAEAAGAVVIAGKTNMHELAFGVTGINPWFGTPVNPLDASLVPGGSSSGSAVAVADGEADVAFGSDTGGSIRIPAACCGVVGLKTTRGRIPLDGVLPLAPSLDTVGPMAATVAGVVAGMQLLEPGFTPATRGSAAGIRIGRVRLAAAGWIDEAINSAIAAAGLRASDVGFELWDRATNATMTILSAEAWQTHSDLWASHAGELSPDVAARLEASSKITPAQVAEGWGEERLWTGELQQVFGRVDVIAMPTTADAPPTIEDGARLTEIRYVAPFNLAGVPALSMPVQTDPVRAGGAVPASLQLVGPAGSEELLCAVAAIVEEASGFSR